jgi:hypothetical protein
LSLSVPFDTRGFARPDVLAWPSATYPFGPACAALLKRPAPQAVSSSMDLTSTRPSLLDSNEERHEALVPRVPVRSHFARLCIRGGLTLWFAAMLAIGTALLVRHEVGLPRPASDSALSAAIATLRTGRDAEKWMSVHVLYAECRCSRGLVDHLTSTARPSGMVEQVLFVGRDA